MAQARNLLHVTRSVLETSRGCHTRPKETKGEVECEKESLPVKDTVECKGMQMSAGKGRKRQARVEDDDVLLGQPSYFAARCLRERGVATRPSGVLERDGAWRKRGAGARKRAPA